MISSGRSRKLKGKTQLTEMGELCELAFRQVRKNSSHSNVCSVNLVTGCLWHNCDIQTSWLTRNIAGGGFRVEPVVGLGSIPIKLAILTSTA